MPLGLFEGFFYGCQVGLQLFLDGEPLLDLFAGV
jgi:hypothetical protein